uniref:NADH dehydrogenase subunit 2 n=1 Tax=Eudiplozoon sp. DZ-2018 TaxID=2340794 RepID=A0A386PZQ9_9PLAT|nr:NADH dehydrogenase subunit 2 [Eudiplozoon sp. DZ-2018]
MTVSNFIIWLFSFLVMFACLISNNLVLCVFLMEVSSVVVFPLILGGNNGVLVINKAVVVLFIVSSVSGLFLLFGLLFNVWNLIYLGLCLKVGLFPFCWWVYLVFSGVGYDVILFINIFHKLPILVIGSFVGAFSGDMFFLFFSFSVFFIFICLLIAPSYSYFLAGSSIASSLVLISVVDDVPFCIVLSLLVLGWCYYFLLVLFFYSCVNSGFLSCYLISDYLWLFYIFISFPISLSVLYKIYSLYCLSLVSLFLVGVWCVYQVLEQVWFINLIFLLSGFGLNSEETEGRLV